MSSSGKPCKDKPSDTETLNKIQTDQYKLPAVLGGKNKIKLLNNVFFYINTKVEYTREM